MIAIRITDIKAFMNCLLNTQTFDEFLLEEATIVTFNTFILDGHIIENFYSKEELEDPAFNPYGFSMWKDMRATCFSLIKGKKTPVQFKFTLHANPAFSTSILEKGNYVSVITSLKAFVLNIKYENGGLNCITATSFHTFFMDKTPDNLWDQAFCNFLNENKISFETL